MGDAQNQLFQLSFNPRLRIEFQGSRVTSDGGLILVRELDERLGFSDLIAKHVTDPRGKNAQFPLVDLVRQSVYRRLAGYEDVNDAERLAHDPTFRLIGSEQLWERGAALTSRVHSFETELLARDENLAGLVAINRELIARVEASDSLKRVVLDLDSTEIPVYGEQEQSAYNGHFEATCYHPLLLFNREGTASGRSCDRATSTAPSGGTRCSCPRSRGSRSRARRWWCGPTPPSPNPRSTGPWRSGTCDTRSASPPTTSWSRKSRRC